MTDMFGDAEPEDSWSPDDPVPDLIVNLIRRRARDDRDRTLDDVRRRMFDEDLQHVLDRVRLEAEPDPEGPGD